MRIGGLSFFSAHWSEVRGRWFEIASWHNPKRQLWKWLLHLDRVVADERRAVRIWHQGGYQSGLTLQLWTWNLRFMWQNWPELGRPA